VAERRTDGRTQDLAHGRRRGERWQPGSACIAWRSVARGPFRLAWPVPQHQVETDGATFGRATIDQHRGRDGSSGAGETFRTGRIWMGVSAGLSETRHSKGAPRHEASQPIVSKSLPPPPAEGGAQGWQWKRVLFMARCIRKSGRTRCCSPLPSRTATGGGAGWLLSLDRPESCRGL
jgi:hypothetical protein